GGLVDDLIAGDGRFFVEAFGEREHGVGVVLLQPNPVRGGGVVIQLLKVFGDGRVELARAVGRARGRGVRAGPKRRAVEAANRLRRRRAGFTRRGVDVLAPGVLVHVDHDVDARALGPADDLGDALDVVLVELSRRGLEQAPG